MAISRNISALTTPAVFVLSISVALTVGSAAAQWSWVSLIVLLPLTGRAAGHAAER